MTPPTSKMAARGVKMALKMSLRIESPKGPNGSLEGPTGSPQAPNRDWHGARMCISYKDSCVNLRSTQNHRSKRQTGTMVPVCLFDNAKNTSNPWPQAPLLPKIPARRIKQGTLKMSNTPENR